jgi:hypothetical protein
MKRSLRKNGATTQAVNVRSNETQGTAGNKGDILPWWLFSVRCMMYLAYCLKKAEWPLCACQNRREFSGGKLMCITRMLTIAVVCLFATVLVLAGEPGKSPPADWPRWLQDPPSDRIIAGNLVTTDGKWYALNGNQIRSLEKVLAKQPLALPLTGGVPRRQPYNLVLWRLDGHSVLPAEIVAASTFSGGKAFFSSENRGHFYIVDDSPKYRPLVDLFAGILNGHEIPMGREATGLNTSPSPSQTTNQGSDENKRDALPPSDGGHGK